MKEIDPNEYASLFRAGQATTRAALGIAGRVLKGQTERDFRRLSDDPERPLVFLLDGDGLRSFLGLSPREILERLGYLPEFVEAQLQAGKTFRLAVFPRPPDLVRGSWDQVLDLAGEIFPDALSNLLRHRAGLKATEFAEHVEASRGFPWQEVRNQGRSHPAWVGVTAMRAPEPPPLWKVRAFLFCELRLSALFAGDGFTRLPDGSPGLSEWVTRNRDLSELGEVVMIPLDLRP